MTMIRDWIPPRAGNVVCDRIVEPERLCDQKEELAEQADFFQSQRVVSGGKQECFEGQQGREIFAGRKHAGCGQPRQQAQAGKESNGRIKGLTDIRRRGYAPFPECVEDHQHSNDYGLSKTGTQGKFVSGKLIAQSKNFPAYCGKRRRERRQCSELDYPTGGRQSGRQHFRRPARGRATRVWYCPTW